MDPISSLSQTKLTGKKLELRKPRKFDTKSILGFAIVVLVIAAVLTGVYLFLNRPAQSGAQNDTTVDNRALEMVLSKPERTIVNPSTEVTVMSNKEVTMEQNNRASLHSIGEADGLHYYIVRIVNLPVNKSEMTLKFSDAVGNKSEQKITITRSAFTFPPGYTQILPWDGAEYVLNADKLDVKVDKKHRLLEDYEPKEIVDLNKVLGLYTLNNATLNREAGNALKAMLDELAKQTGKFVTVASGYRSYEEQVGRYSSLVRQLGEAQASTLSAKPGHSEHQLGTAVDLVSEETNWQIKNEFGDTEAGKWLAQNCSKYGFVEGTAQATEGNPASGTWLFRYVGIQPVTN